MPLFTRIAELTIGDTQIRGLDISFFVEKTLTAEPNTAEIRIYNLNDANRKLLSDQQTIPVMLKAGYKGSVGLLFKGDLSEVFSQREGPDWVTTIRSGDGLMAVRSVVIQQWQHERLLLNPKAATAWSVAPLSTVAHKLILTSSSGRRFLWALLRWRSRFNLTF